MNQSNTDYIYHSMTSPLAKNTSFFKSVCFSTVDVAVFQNHYLVQKNSNNVEHDEIGD